MKHKFSKIKFPPYEVNMHGKNSLYYADSIDNSMITDLLLRHVNVHSDNLFNFISDMEHQKPLNELHMTYHSYVLTLYVIRSYSIMYADNLHTQRMKIRQFQTP